MKCSEKRLLNQAKHHSGKSPPVTIINYKEF